MDNIYWASLSYMCLGYGPWTTSAWFNLILAQARTLKQQLHPDHVALMQFWPKILVDRGQHLEMGHGRSTGRAARVEFLRSFDADRLCDLKIGKVKPQIWMSWQNAHASWDLIHHERAMVLTQACINKNLIAASEDLFAPTTIAGFKDPNEVDGDGRPKKRSKAASVRAAKQEVDSFKNRHQNAVVAGTRLMCNTDIVYGSRILALGTRAEAAEFGRVACTFKGPDAVSAVCQQWAQWSWLETLKETVRSATDLKALSRCGFRVEFPEASRQNLMITSPEVKYEDSIANTLGVLISRITSTRAGSMLMWTDQYPYKLAAMLDPASSQRAMSEFQRDVKAFWAAKDLYASEMYIATYFRNFSVLRCCCGSASPQST